MFILCALFRISQTEVLKIKTLIFNKLSIVREQWACQCEIGLAAQWINGNIGLDLKALNDNL